MAEIVISEFMDEAAIEQIFCGREVRYDPALVDKPEELAAALIDCRALVVRNRTQVTEALLGWAPQLRVVGRLGVGLDNIDLPACAARGVAVRPASGANDLAVAEYVLSAALALLRRAWFASNAVIEGEWPRIALIGRELDGKRLGLVGFGAIAQLTAERARSLGMTIAAFDPFQRDDHPAWSNVERMGLEQLLSTSDVVSLHTPLTAQTRHMIDAPALSLMRGERRFDQRRPGRGGGRDRFGRGAEARRAWRRGAGRVRNRAGDRRIRDGFPGSAEFALDPPHRRSDRRI